MGLKEVYVVGHSDCGMRKQKPEDIREKMKERGIPGGGNRSHRYKGMVRPAAG
jgi:carbonic anhydrase